MADVWPARAEDLVVDRTNALEVVSVHKDCPLPASLSDRSRNATPTVLVRRLLRADPSGVRVDIALRRKVVVLRAVLMSAMV